MIFDSMTGRRWFADAGANSRAILLGTAAAGLMLLTACAAPAPKDQAPRAGGAAAVAIVPGVAAPPVLKDRAPRPAAPATSAVPVQDGAAAAAADWHPLVVAPFGTLLKDSPVRLHEVLLFHDESAAAESKDCYAIDAPPPLFLGSPPDEFLMCFEHDRLNRIDVSVPLAAAVAPADFVQACASWLKSTEALPTADHACAGRDGDIAFSARLSVAADEPMAELLLTLWDAAAPGAEQASP